jgi:hypothetical protein
MRMVVLGLHGWALCLVLLLAAGVASAAGPATSPAPVRVSYDEVLAAMRASTGYDRLATANGGRLQSEVLLRLARAARERAPDGPPLLVGHEDWYRALLDVTGVDEAHAPVYAQLAYRHGQDVMAEYVAGRVVKDAGQGRAPVAALNVTIFWPDAPGAPREYTYEDTRSTPHLRVTNHRLITYRLLDFGDEVAFEEIEGLYGRPTSGALGLLFGILGDARIVEYRMAIGPGGVQVSRGRARKGFFEVATTATIQPDGGSARGVPADPVLRAIEERLERPLTVRYVPR